jgi:hypothetical protein
MTPLSVILSVPEYIQIIRIPSETDFTIAIYFDQVHWKLRKGVSLDDVKSWKLNLSKALTR